MDDIERAYELFANQRDRSLLVEHARVHDLTIMPVPEFYDQWYAEELIFESGRPALILPAVPLARPFELETLVVAWDFSQTAARAVADALPLLDKARKVRVVTVVNEKSFETKTSNEQLAKNLARHGIDVVLDNVDAAGRPIGEVLEAYVLSHKADVLVMGLLGTRNGAKSCMGAQPKVSCRNRRFRFCFRTDDRKGRRYDEGRVASAIRNPRNISQ